MMDLGTANMALAASICERAHDLIETGWVKGTWHSGYDGVQTFCIEGALDLALEELLNQGDRAAPEIKEIARMFILDEALARYKFTGAYIPGFNDAGERTHDEVLSVLDGAARRLWAISVADEELGQVWQPSQWADLGLEESQVQQYQQNYMLSVLA